MQIKDVPQESGMSGDQKEVCYAVDADGRYTLVSSLGWGPKNIANEQAWELIEEEVNAVLIRVKENTSSPLAYHMTRNLMNIKLLSQYSGFFRFQVYFHLTPRGFRRLSPVQKQRYADVFGISVDELDRIPNKCQVNPHHIRPDSEDTI
jgi:hypothetical protein